MASGRLLVKGVGLLALTRRDLHAIAVAAKAAAYMILNPLETRETLKYLLGEARGLAKRGHGCKALTRRTIEVLSAFTEERPSTLFTEYSKLFHSVRTREALCPPFASLYVSTPLNTLLMSLQMLYARAALETQVRDPDAMEHMAALLELYAYLLEKAYHDPKSIRYYARVASDLLRTVLLDAMKGFGECLEERASLPQYKALAFLFRELHACSKDLSRILSQSPASLAAGGEENAGQQRGEEAGPG